MKADVYIIIFLSMVTWVTGFLSFAYAAKSCPEDYYCYNVYNSGESHSNVNVRLKIISEDKDCPGNNPIKNIAIGGDVYFSGVINPRANKPNDRCSYDLQLQCFSDVWQTIPHNQIKVDGFKRATTIHITKTNACFATPGIP